MTPRQESSKEPSRETAREVDSPSELSKDLASVHISTIMGDIQKWKKQIRGQVKMLTEQAS